MASPADLTGRQSVAGLTGKMNPLGAKPNLSSILGKPEQTPNPLADVEYTDNIAADSAAELTALEQGYRDRAKQEGNRFRNATDSEYWFAVCFKTRAEKEAFLTEYGLLPHGDKYLDGAVVDAVLKTRQG